MERAQINSDELLNWYRELDVILKVVKRVSKDDNINVGSRLDYTVERIEYLKEEIKRNYRKCF